MCRGLNFPRMTSYRDRSNIFWKFIHWAVQTYPITKMLTWIGRFTAHWKGNYLREITYLLYTTKSRDIIVVWFHIAPETYKIAVVSLDRIRDRLDLAVLFTPSTPNRQNWNQVRWNTCAGVRRSTPSSKVVQTEQSPDLFQNKMVEHSVHCTDIFFSLSW